MSGCSSRFLESDIPEEVEYVTKLIELGYKDEVGYIADNYSDNTKDILLKEYNKDYESIISINSDEKVLKYYIDNEIDIDTFLSIISDRFFRYKNIDKYIEYQEEFDEARLLVEYVNAKAYKIPYEEIEETDLTKNNLMIASKIYYLDKYVPDDLVDVDEGYYILALPKLQKEAKEAYEKMADDARSEGLDFYISTAYRSYDFQETLYNGYLAGDNQESVDSYSSRPGYSDHQIGLSADIRTKDKAFEEFTNTDEAKWLKENAHKYGFILRYPEDKEKVTGYIYESWHFRYVGEAASFIYKNNITFDEYYACYVE